MKGNRHEGVANEKNPNLEKIEYKTRKEIRGEPFQGRMSTRSLGKALNYQGEQEVEKKIRGPLS